MTIETPETLFGKKPFTEERKVLSSFTHDIEKGTFWIDPMLFGLAPELMLFSEEFREKQAKKHLERAKVKLESIL